MEALRRIKKVINWLIFKEIASNERELAEVMVTRNHRSLRL